MPPRTIRNDWKVVDLIDRAKTFFQNKGIADTARLDAELLLARVLGCGRIDLYVRFDRIVAEPQLSEFRELVRQRGARRPVKQILGRCEFMSHELEITPDVLVPRPETETLVACVLAGLADGPQAVADIGTGSGAIAVAIALARPEATVYATDISRDALEVARRNMEKHGLTDRVTTATGDLFEPLARLGLEGTLDVVVANPPYVAESEFADLMPEVAEHEPRVALVSGPDGMEHTRRLLAEAPAYLRPGGLLAVETSPTTAPRARAQAEAHDAYEGVRTAPDLNKTERVLLARKR